MSAARKLAPPPEPEKGPASSPAALYATHLALVWRNLRRFGVAPELLEDAAQDVFVTVHRRWQSFDPRASSIETWLFGIVIRVAQYHRRTLRRRLARLVPWFHANTVHDVASALEGPLDALARREAIVVLDGILDGLGENQRDILVLVDVEQVSVPEAASILGINLNTAYTRLRTARLRFQDAVDRLRAIERRRLGRESHD
ncbi:MAG TPA: sigma-70 family RNA polymerase sigma factor [Polyangiaceae bacterium]